MKRPLRVPLSIYSEITPILPLCFHEPLRFRHGRAYFVSTCLRRSLSVTSSRPHVLGDAVQESDMLHQLEVQVVARYLSEIFRARWTLVESIRLVVFFFFQNSHVSRHAKRSMDEDQKHDMMKNKTFTCTPQWTQDSHRTTNTNVKLPKGARGTAMAKMRWPFHEHRRFKMPFFTETEIVTK